MAWSAAWRQSARPGLPPGRAQSVPRVQPQWGADGRTIYYGTGDRIMRVRLNPSTGDIGNAELLGKIRPGLTYSVAPDGRFLISRIDPGAEIHAMKLVLNWTSVLDSKNQ